MSENTSDVIIIGGGVAGLSTAMQLAKRGTTVTVLEREQIGNGSTGNVVVYQYAYETAGRSGIASSLTAIQILSLKEYSGAVMFEPVAVDTPAESGTADQMPF